MFKISPVLAGSALSILKFVGTVSGNTMKGVADFPKKGRKNWTVTK